MRKINKTLLFSVLAIGAFQAHAQTYNFDDASLTDTTGQTTLVPFNIFGSGQIPAPADGTISAADVVLNLGATHFGMGTAFDPTVLGTILGPTRIGVVNPVPYEDFEVSMVITDFGGLDPFFLLGARLTDFGHGTTKGYGVQIGYRPSSGNRQISMVKIENENPEFISINSELNASTLSDFTEDSQFKIVFTGRGSLLTLFVDDLSTDEPGYYFSANDDTFTAGVTGIIVAAGLSTPEVTVAGKIDDFVSRPAPNLPTPPSLSIAEAVMLSWPMMEGNFVLDSAPSPFGRWTQVETPVVEVDGELRASVIKRAAKQYFQLRAVE